MGESILTYFICTCSLWEYIIICAIFITVFSLPLNSNSTCRKIDPGDLGNQRPVSLMSALGKLVLMVMKRRKKQLSIQRNKVCCKKINMGFWNDKSYFYIFLRVSIGTWMEVNLSTLQYVWISKNPLIKFHIKDFGLNLANRR